MRRWFRFFLLIAGFLNCQAVAAAQLSFVLPDRLEWRDAGPTIPKAQVAKVFNDPKDKGVYTMRLKLPPNYQYASHSPAQIEYVTIISGSMYMGEGDVFTKEKGTFLPTGASIMIPAKASHFAWTTNEGVIMEIYGQGPRNTNFVK